MTFDIVTSFYSMLVESHMSSCLALIAVTLNVIQLCLWLRLQKSHEPEREPLVTRDQEVSTSTCCGAGVLQLLLSQLSPTEPPPEINMEEEMKQSYMEAFRRLYEEEEYPQEKVVAAIKYMNTLRGGIQAHRNSDSLICALEHIKSMECRMDDSGIFEDYTLEDLQHILVETNEYPIDDFNQLVGKFIQKHGFPPSPTEFVEIHDKQKVKLEKALESSRKKYMSLEQRVQQKDQTLQQKDQALLQHQQALQDARLANQQKDRMLDHKDRLLQQMRQKNRELEQGGLQKCMCEMEKENQCLSQRLKCKICRVEEVQVLLSPCYHLVCCQECVSNLPKKWCPICATKIQGTIKVFFA